MNDRQGGNAPKPLVSVVICVHDGELFLRQALDSVFSQSLSNFEVIAVDDGSQDGSEHLLQSCDDRRLRVIRQQNQGAPSALKTGFRSARGDFVAILDQDDLWLPEQLSVCIGVLETHPEVDMVFSWYRVINEHGRETGLHSHRYRGTIDFKGLLEDFVIGATSNIVVRRAALVSAGGPDAAFPRFYDLDFCLRVALLRPHNILAVPQELTLYRRHSSQLTRVLSGMPKEWEAVVAKLKTIAPDEVARVAGHARCNFSRFFARIAYENGEFVRALGFLLEGFRHSPLCFLLNQRNWAVTAASVAGALLPAGALRVLERIAGFDRG